MATTEGASRNRAVLTVLGSDRSGIVAAVATCLAGHDVNILDISQTILQGIFTMTMICDLDPSDADFDHISAELDELSQRLGVQITFQREDVFNFMYRL